LLFMDVGQSKPIRVLMIYNLMAFFIGCCG
jgi:hypothetical protein